MANTCSSKLVAGDPPAFAHLRRPGAGTQCPKRKHILLAFARRSDVITSEPSLPQKLVLLPCRIWPTWPDPDNSAFGEPTMRIPTICLLVVLAIVFCSGAHGQGGASVDLHVIVKDPNCILVTGANVTVRDEAKGTEHPATGSRAGEYSVLALPPASYTVTVSAPGFATATAPHVSITVGGSAELPINLSVASMSEKVEVSSEAELI